MKEIQQIESFFCALSSLNGQICQGFQRMKERKKNPTLHNPTDTEHSPKPRCRTFISEDSDLIIGKNTENPSQYNCSFILPSFTCWSRSTKLKFLKPFVVITYLRRHADPLETSTLNGADQLRRTKLGRTFKASCSQCFWRKSIIPPHLISSRLNPTSCGLSLSWSSMDLEAVLRCLLGSQP